MSRMRIVGLVAGLGFIVGAAPPPAARELFVVKEFPAFKVMVPQEKSAWCGPVANITIVGQSGDQFTQNELVIQRIVGGLRAVMSFECPEATKIQLTGSVNDQPLYQAYATASNNWALQGVELRSAAKFKQLADMEAVGKCDELGASPDDPEALTAGVPDSALNGAKVVDACQRAVAIDGDSPRLKYQLARGLLKVDRGEDALEQLIPAAEAGHGGSLALLGDIHLAGAAGIEADPVAAKSFYEKAAAAKFEPAKLALRKFEDQTKALAQAEAEERQAAKDERAAAQVSAAQPVRVAAERTSSRSLNLQGYEYPNIIEAIYSGNGDDLGGERGTKIYLVNMASVFQGVCRGSFSINEMNGLKMSVIDKSDMTSQAGWTGLYDMAANLAQIIQNPGAMTQIAQNAQSASTQPEQASNDAMLFIERNNCGSPAFNKFTTNLRSYVKDQSTSANLATTEYSNACMAGARPSHYSVGDFCGCFIARANSAGLSRSEKKALLVSFWPTATNIMNRDPDHFGPCNGSLAR